MKSWHIKGLLIALVMMVIGAGSGRAFDVKKFLYTKEFIEYMKEYKLDSIFNKCKAEYTVKYREILTSKNISETIDYLKDIYVADKDTSYLTPIREALVIVFFNQACGAPEVFLEIGKPVEYHLYNDPDNETLYKTKNLKNNFIPVIVGWYEENYQYISQHLIDLFCEVIATNVALQKCFCLDPETDENWVGGFGTWGGWGTDLWSSSFWMRYKNSPIWDFYVKLFGLRQSFPSMFYWYRIGNNLNELSPYEVITCGYEIENMPRTKFDIYPDPPLHLPY